MNRVEESLKGKYFFSEAELKELERNVSGLVAIAENSRDVCETYLQFLNSYPLLFKFSHRFHLIPLDTALYLSVLRNKERYYERYGKYNSASDLYEYY